MGVVEGDRVECEMAVVIVFGFDFMVEFEFASIVRRLNAFFAEYCLREGEFEVQSVIDLATTWSDDCALVRIQILRN